MEALNLSKTFSTGFIASYKTAFGTLFEYSVSISFPYQGMDFLPSVRKSTSKTFLTSLIPSYKTAFGALFEDLARISFTYYIIMLATSK